MQQKNVLDRLSEAEMFEQGKEYLEKLLDIKIEPDARCSSTAFLMVYKVADPYPSKGMKYPTGFKVLRQLSPSEFIQLNKDWRTALKSLEGENSLEIAEFWLPALAAVPGRSQLEQYVMTLLQLDARYSRSHAALSGFSTGITFDPQWCMSNREVPQAFVPDLSWFPEQVRSLSPQDIVTLFPEAELSMLMLFMGRVLCGRDNSTPLGYGKRLEHKFRKMLLVFGADSGTGKSTLFEWMNQTLQMLGYEVVPFKDIGARFGQADTYMSNLAFRDDSTRDSVQKLLHSSELKSLITGSQLVTEAKNKAAISVNPTAALMLITNEMTYHNLFKVDSGVLNRLSILYTKTLAELANITEAPSIVKPGYPYVQDLDDYRSFAYLGKLGKAMGCSVHTLLMYFLRLSADYFIEQHEQGTLEEEIAHITSHLVFPVNNSNTSNLVSSMVLANLLRTSENAPKAKRLLPLSNKKTLLWIAQNFAWLKGNPEAHYVRELIKQDWTNRNRPLAHPWTALRNVSVSSLIDFLDKIVSVIDIRGVSLNQAIKESFQLLQSNDGISLSVGPSFFKSAWQETVEGPKGQQLLGLRDYIMSQLGQAPIVHEQTLKAMLNPEQVGPQLEYSLGVGYSASAAAEQFAFQLGQARTKGVTVIYEAT